MPTEKQILDIDKHTLFKENAVLHLLREKTTAAAVSTNACPTATKRPNPGLPMCLLNSKSSATLLGRFPSHGQGVAHTCETSNTLNGSIPFLSRSFSPLLYRHRQYSRKIKR